uniref:SUEL-type lectin domain-containing protein n=1 Tax=Amphilophus citrinellus TaxID=61819 RepID=A0A3Q0T8K0_AMPCI
MSALNSETWLQLSLTNVLANLVPVTLTVHLIACEHSLAHLQCGKLTHDVTHLNRSLLLFQASFSHKVILSLIDAGQIIHVYHADFGRRDPNICSFRRDKERLQNVKCSRPTNKVAERCNRRSSCSMRAASSVFEDACPNTYKYLELTYTCQRNTLCEYVILSLIDAGQIIHVYHADFGRQDPNICSFRRDSAQLQNVKCSRPTNKVAERCNGSNSCSIQAECSVLGNACPNTYKYLELTYTCQRKYLKGESHTVCDTRGGKKMILTHSCSNIH